MRAVQRPTTTPDTLLSKGLDEQDKAAVVIGKWRASLQATPAGDDAPKKPSISFAAYKAADVKALLVEAFKGKCAYCESFYSSTQPMDVEHYRPKGAVEGADNHPGYFWLAATWGNLLPSCIDCNRRRTQFDVVVGESRLLGKKDLFPVAGTRATDPISDIDDRERPLLVDPCLTDPGRIFKYDHQFGLVLPRFKSGKKHNRAMASIEVYGLNRSGLVADRLHIVRQLDLHLLLIDRLNDVRVLLDTQAPNIPQAATLIDELISIEMRALIEMGAPDRPYAAMVNQILDDLDGM